MRDPGMRCSIEPARYANGRPHQGLNVVKILAGNGEQPYELIYNADYYRRPTNSTSQPQRQKAT